MTAPQHTAKPTADQPKADQEDNSSTNRYRLQRCWFVTLGLLGSFSFVASQVNFARAESPDFSADAAAAETATTNVYANASTNVSYTAGAASYEAAPYSAQPAFELRPTAQLVAAALIDAPPVPSVAAASFAIPDISSASATPSDGVPAIAPAVGLGSAAAIAPQVTPVAPPTFTPVKKAAAKPAQRHNPLLGLIEAGAMASTLAMDDAAPNAAPSAARTVPDIAPAAQPAAPPIVEAAPVRPTELVPAALPEGNLPEEYNSVFVDPTDYSVGATEAPSVVISEQSTGCEFTVRQGQAVPNGACASSGGAAASGQAAPSAASAATSTPARRSASVASEPAVNVGPVSFSAAGIRFSGSTTAAGREFLNRSVRPLVNLQAARQFIFPLAIPAQITSLFGFRVHPITGDQRFHAGTDIGAAQGTPVLAAQDGVVTAADYAGGYGLMVVLRHQADGTQLESRYAHLSEVLVEPGKQVRKGDVVGLVGSTGNSTGPHLHFEMHQLTADGWVVINPDGLIQQSLANLVRALNDPSFNLADYLSAARAQDAPTPAGASVGVGELPELPGQNGISFRPAQPNAS